MFKNSSLSFLEKIVNDVATLEIYNANKEECAMSAEAANWSLSEAANISFAEAANITFAEAANIAF